MCTPLQSHALTQMHEKQRRKKSFVQPGSVLHVSSGRSVVTHFKTGRQYGALLGTGTGESV